jgi:hypothetical protein
LRAGSLPSLAYLVTAGGVLLLALTWAVLLWRRRPSMRDEPPLPDLATEVHIDLRERR